jgi:hypothetical protein
MNALTTGMVVVVGVALAAWLLRRFSGDDGVDREGLAGRAAEPGGTARPAPPTDEAPAEDAPDEVEAGPTAVAAITSEGLLFLPFEQGVQMLLPASRDVLARELTDEAVSRGRVLGVLSAGDLVAARVVRGAPGVDPWRLEALGRDREYLAWSFETQEAARAALDLLQGVVVRAPEGFDGEPFVATDGDFAEALSVHEQTLQELAMMPDEEEPEEPGK